MFFISLHLGLYVIAWIVIAIIFFARTKSFGFGGILLTTYFVSALGSLIYYFGIGGFLSEGQDISWEPLLYLFLCLNVCMLPIYRHSKDLAQVKYVSNKSGDTFLRLFILFLSPLIIEVTVELFLFAVTTNTSGLGAIYEDDSFALASQLSSIGSISDAICSRFCFIWPILFFHFFCSEKKLSFYSIVPLLAFLSRILYAYAAASRVGLVREVLYFLIIFLLFAFSLSNRQRKKILKGAFVVFGVIVVFLAVISVSRYQTAATKTIDFGTWLALYLGEGPIKFCQYLWDVDVTMQGDNIFSLVKKILGMNPITDAAERREYWLTVSGIPNHIFYTWIGDIYFDIGRIGTVFFVICFFFLSEWYIKRIIKRKYLDFGSTLIIGLLLLNLTFGIMYMPFKLYRIQIRILWCIILVLMYQISTYSKKKKIK